MGLLTLSDKILKNLDKSTLCPDKVQKEFLLRILKKNHNTEYGLKYSFASISDEASFKRNLPIVKYNDIEPYVKRLMTGDRNILTSDSVTMFAKTSGTTASPKYIPITRQVQKRTADFIYQWLCRAQLDHPSFLEKGFLIINSPVVEGYTESGIPYGSASGMLYSALPDAVRGSFVIPDCLARISDYSVRYFAMARLVYEKSVSFIVTPNPLTLVNLAKSALSREEELIRSIHNGWLSEKIRSEKDYINAGLPADIISWIKPNKTRAQTLSGIFEKTGKLLPVDCWPGLSFIGCWLGGSIGFHSELLDEYYGNIPKRNIGYMASEGCFSIPFHDSAPGGILALSNNYYEFIPENITLPKAEETLTASEIEEGKSYKIILTNEGGLYRYDIDDIIKVEGFYKRTPVISFLRKGNSSINISGEKLHLEHVLFALRRIQSKFSLDIHQFRIVPDMRKLRHELLVNIKAEISVEFIKTEIIPALDKFLCECNAEYDSRRKSGRLKMPCIHIMALEWAEDSLKSQIKSGQRDVQCKWRNISSEFIEADRKYIKCTIE